MMSGWWGSGGALTNLKRKEMEGMRLYEKLGAFDVLRPVKELLVKGTCRVDHESGKIVLRTEGFGKRNFLFSGVDKERKCMLWSFYFNHYGLIHKECLGCWKVVAKVKRLKELVKMLSVQKEMGLPSKCGVELRAFAKRGGLYSGYWYVPLGSGMKEGLELKERVVKELADAGVEVGEVLLKRGCTEFEMVVGDSKEWDKIAKEQEWEQKSVLLDSLFVSNELEWPEARMKFENLCVKPLVLREWVEYAADAGDEDYRGFIDGDFWPSVRKYTKEDLKDEAGGSGEKGITLV